MAVHPENSVLVIVQRSIVNTKLRIAVAGAIVGFLGAVGIYFAPEEPYKHFVVAAGTLSGVVLALLITAAVDAKTPLLSTLLAGAGLGLLNSATIFSAMAQLGRAVRHPNWHH